MPWTAVSAFGYRGLRSADDPAVKTTLPIVLVLAAAAFAGDAPVWTRWMKLSDGRTFVSDGAIALDAALAKPSALPKDEIPNAKVVEDHLAARPSEEVRASELERNPDGRTYRTPSGVLLSAGYVAYLRSVAPPGTLRFRVGGDRKPIVIVSDGTAVGIVMPIVGR